MADDPLKDELRSKANDLGFDLFGVSDMSALGDTRAQLNAFLAKGYQGDMAWMEKNVDRRADPRILWPDMRSVVMLGKNYGPDADPLEKLSKSASANFSVYALGKDYHEVIKKKLKRLARWLCQQTGGEAKVFVDTAPVMENPWLKLPVLGGRESTQI